MSLAHNSRQYMGVRAKAPPDLQIAERAPTSADTAYVPGTIWMDKLNDTSYQWPGSGNWIALGSGAVGGIVTLTGTSGGAISPVGGNIDILGGPGITVVGTAGTLTINLAGGSTAIDSFVPGTGTNPVVPTALGAVTMAGTANQITTTGGLNTLTFSVPATFIAPGTIASTTTITSGTSMVATTTFTAGTGITSTLGNIVASAGNITATLGSVAAGTTVTAGTVITATLGNITATNGNVVLGTSGNKILSTSVGSTTAAGANSFGKVTLVGGSAVVSTTSALTASIIILTTQALGTVATPMPIAVTARTNATSFTITSSDGTDTSSIGWMIIN